MENQTQARQARLEALNKLEHAGFLIRWLAVTIDAFFLMIPVMIFGLVAALLRVTPEQIDNMPSWVENVLKLTLFGIGLLYQGYFLSTSGATPGKKYCNLKVIDLQTVRYPTFSKALLRALSSYVSWIILYIGYLMVAFRKDKRALHDLMVKTVVVKVSKD